MQIKEKNPQTCFFSDVKNGEIVRDLATGILWLKIQPSSSHNVVQLSSGATGWMVDGRPIEPVTGEFVVTS